MQSLVKDTVYPLGFERVKKNDVKGSHADSVYDTKTLIGEYIQYQAPCLVKQLVYTPTMMTITKHPNISWTKRVKSFYLLDQLGYTYNENIELIEVG